MIGTGIVHQGGGASLVQAGPTLGLDEIQRWAKVFVDSGMFKDSKSLAQAIVKIQAGQELGLPPFAAMRGFDVIEGKPAPNAGLTSALVRRSGRYDYRVTRSDNTVCELEWLDHGRSIGSSAFTLDEAKAAGLASKQVWRAYASDMLFARALTRGARRFCADVFLGSVYTPEELGDDPPIDAEPLRELPTPEHEFNGPGSFTDATDAEFTEATEPEHVDVESWRATIEAASTSGDLMRLFNRIGTEETNPYRKAGAWRIVAERFLDMIPESIKVEAIEPCISALSTMLTALNDAAVPKLQREAHDQTLSRLDERLVWLTSCLPPDDDADTEGV